MRKAVLDLTLSSFLMGKDRNLSLERGERSDSMIIGYNYCTFFKTSGQWVNRGQATVIMSAK